MPVIRQSALTGLRKNDETDKTGKTTPLVRLRAKPGQKKAQDVKLQSTDYIKCEGKWFSMASSAETQC